MMNSKRYWILNDKMKDYNGFITWNGLSISSEFLENTNLNLWWFPSDIDDEFLELISGRKCLILIRNFIYHIQQKKRLGY